MLHVILLVIKIIGILLLTILLLLLTLVLMVLFVPIRYRINAEHGKELLLLDAKVYWFLHLIGARITHSSGVFHMRVRILWFTLYDNLKPNKPKALRHNKEQRFNRKNRTLRDVEEPAIRNRSEDTGRNTNEKTEVNTETEENTQTEENTETEGIIEEINEAVEEYDNRKPSFWSRVLLKLKKVFNKMIHLLERLKRFIAELINRVKGWLESSERMKHKIEILSEFVQDELNREGFRITYTSLERILKHVLPTRLKSNIIFGTGDPCTTGQLLGIAGILLSLYGDRLQITPDFQNKILEGKHDARGRIRLVTILIIVIKLILNRRFKQLKKNVKILKEAL